MPVNAESIQGVWIHNIILHSRKKPDREKIVRFFECNEFIIFQLSTLCSWLKDKLQMGFAQIT